MSQKKTRKEKKDENGKERCMLAKINGTLRKIILIVGAVCIIFKLTEKNQSEQGDDQEGFQTEEFDDIW